MNDFLRAPAAGLLLVLAVAASGCKQSAPDASPAAPVPVTVAYPIEREVTDYGEYTGRTAAVDSVEVRARVWGYLDKVNFKEGALVKKDDVLFEIDSRPYKAALAQADGNLGSARAHLTRVDADLERVKKLPPNTVSPQEMDKYTGDRAEAAAAVEALKATVEQAKLDLDYTKVIAPVGGRVGRYLVTAGNLIQAGATGGTVLTTIVSVDPIYAYADIDESTVLRVRQMIREGKAKSARDVDLPISLGLANEVGFPHPGVLNFVNNQVDARTGTLRIRGTFPNKDESLAPGYFCRVRVPLGYPHRSLLVNERALETDQGQRILYVLNEKNEVIPRPVQLGSLHDGLREITDGLKSGERVVVVGTQQVRAGVVVEPTIVEMPSKK
jgi:RND family efflux transporter MFP subunit